MFLDDSRRATGEGRQQSELAERQVLCSYIAAIVQHFDDKGGYMPSFCFKWPLHDLYLNKITPADLRFKFIGIVVTRRMLKQAQKFTMAVLSVVILRIINYFFPFADGIGEAMPIFRDFTLLISV